MHFLSIFCCCSCRFFFQFSCWHFQLVSLHLNRNMIGLLIFTLYRVEQVDRFLHPYFEFIPHGYFKIITEVLCYIFRPLKLG
jgi:hypothetical protein